MNIKGKIYAQTDAGIYLNIVDDKLITSDSKEDMEITLPWYTDHKIIGKVTDGTEILFDEPIELFDLTGDFTVRYEPLEDESVTFETDLKEPNEVKIVTWTEDDQELTLDVGGIPYDQDIEINLQDINQDDITSVEFVGEGEYKYKIENDTIHSSIKEGDLLEEVGAHFDSSEISPELSNIGLEVVNSKPIASVKITPGRFIGDIIDKDGGKIFYKVILNKNQFFPEGDDFHEVIGEEEIDLLIPNKLLAMGEENTIEIIYKDIFGTEKSWKDVFIAEPTGLVAYNLEGDLLVDGEGNVLKNIDFGEIIYGQTTDYVEIKVSNNTIHDLKDLVITSSETPANIKLGVSSDDVTHEEIKITGLDSEKSKTIYARIEVPAESEKTPPQEFFLDMVALKKGERINEAIRCEY